MRASAIPRPIRLRPATSPLGKHRRRRCPRSRQDHSVPRNTTKTDGQASPTDRQVRGGTALPDKAVRKPAGATVALFRPTIRRRQMHAVLECLVSEEIGPGPIAKQLTGELAAALDCRGGVAVADYRAATAAALHLAIETAATETGAGDRDPLAGGPRALLMSALAPLDYVYAARAAGWYPLLVDVDPETGSVDAESMRRMLAQRPRALVIGHPPGSIEPLQEARAAGVPIVEDLSAGLLGMVTERAGDAPGNAAAARNAGANGAERGAADDSPADQAELPPARGPAGDVLVIGLHAPGVLAAGGGGLVLARSARGRRVLAGYGDRFGWAGLADVNAALALAQWHDLAAGRRRCAELAARFRDAVARSRHRTLAPAAALGPLFPVVVADGLRAVQRYASRHNVETKLACEGLAITGLLPAEGDPVPAQPDPPPGGGAEERLAGAQELARRCLLFPLYPELTDAQASQVARVLATLP